MQNFHFIGKNFRILIMAAVIPFTVYNCRSFTNSSKSAESTIIPVPAHYKQINSRDFTLTPGTVIYYDSAAGNSVRYLADYLKKFYNLNLSTNLLPDKSKGKPIILTYDSNMVPGQYSLKVSGKKIEITGSEDGTFYGVQSLVQLMPVDFKENKHLKIPSVEIRDQPRFAYRGLLLDVGRHFYTIDFLKRCVDFAALHKMNYFQLHLTDDQGWRVEIKKYPELNKTGSWRNGSMIGLWPGTGNDSLRHGGYYTQQELKDLVSYARERFVTIVPEIEMPGHALAALASYNFLGCTGGPYKVKDSWGYSDDVFCAGKESTYEFLQDVLDEVVDIFPSEYIHIGGDECPVIRWEKCKACQARMTREGLKNERELEGYLIHRMSEYLSSKGRKIIGWDEILEGGAPSGSVIMSWHGMGETGCIKAVRNNHKVILAPSSAFYLDYPQTSTEDSLAAAWGGVTTLKRTYMYEPVNDSLKTEEVALILGSQASIWTEYMNNNAKVEYMTFPRLSAVSEVLWSDPGSKDWEKFKQRLQVQYKRYKMWNIIYNPADPDKD